VETALDSLITAINNRYSGASIDKITDHLVTGSDIYKELEYEILVGETNRDESSEALTDLLQGDWGYKIVGTKIVIKGGSQEALVKGINAFKSAVSGNYAASNFYESSMDKINREKRVGRDLVINGTHISEYTIIYPARGTKFEKELARRLSDRIALITGHILPFYGDNRTMGAHEILIGATNRPFSIQTTSGAAIESDQKYVAVVGSTAYDYGLAQTQLAALIESSSIAKEELVLPAKSEPITSTDDIKTMAYNVYGFDHYASRCDNICRLVTKYLPDILAYQEPDTAMTNKIRMEGYYDWFDGKPRHTRPDGSVATETGGANSISPIFWAKDRFEFILGDTKWTTATPDVASRDPNDSHYRMYTYALLRDKQTGEEFIVVNWHMSTSGDALRTLGLRYMFKFFHEAGYNDMPVIMLGDFNAQANTNVIKEITVNQGGFTSTHLLTPNPAANEAPRIDWIFVKSCCMTASSFKICKETYPDTLAKPGEEYGDGKNPSDHCPVYAVVRIKEDREEHTHDWSQIGAGLTWVTPPTIPTRPSN